MDLYKVPQVLLMTLENSVPQSSIIKIFYSGQKYIKAYCIIKNTSLIEKRVFIKI